MNVFVFICFVLKNVLGGGMRVGGGVGGGVPVGLSVGRPGATEASREEGTLSSRWNSWRD